MIIAFYLLSFRYSKCKSRGLYFQQCRISKITFTLRNMHNADSKAGDDISKKIPSYTVTSHHPDEGKYLVHPLTATAS